MMQEWVTKAADALIDEHRRGAHFRPFASKFGIVRLEDAYSVQGEYVRLQMKSRGVGAAGYKVGLTAKRMQQMCGIDSPVAGVVLQDGVHLSGANLNASAYGRIGLEFEIAVRLSRDLRAAGQVPGLAEVADAVDAVCPAIEVVDDRHADYSSLEVLSVIADNSWNAGIVLGAFTRAWPELATIEGVVFADGIAIDRGCGGDVLGHPFHSVAWLAAHLSKRGEGLRAGDIVMTGNLVNTKFPTKPTTYRFEAAGLGSVDVAIR